MCTQCRAQELATCVYSDKKNEKEQRQLELARLRIEDYEKLLRDISREAEAPVAKKIASILEDPSLEMSEPQKSTFNTSSFMPTCPLDGIVTVDEDFNRTQKSRSTGYMGKNSEVMWIQRLESEATRQDSTGVSLGNDQKYQLPVDNSIASMSYHLDDNRLPGVEATDAFILPSKGLADQLFRVFFQQGPHLIAYYSTGLNHGPIPPLVLRSLGETGEKVAGYL